MKTLKQLREKLGLSQHDLGIYLGKVGSAISNYETGYRNLPVDDAYKLIDLAKEKGLKLKLEDIYPRDE